MRNIRIPGFAGEAALYKTSRPYISVGAFGWRDGEAQPQAFISIKPPGPSGPGVDYACDQTCLNTCPYKNDFNHVQDCNNLCCHLEYFPAPQPRYF